MDQGVEQGSRETCGGILSLVRTIEEHREAIEYDLMAVTGHEIDDIGYAMSWDAFGSFIKNLDYHSALFREMHPDSAVWADTIKTNAILADIYDMLATINANLNALGTRKAAKKPKPYPRPFKKDTENERQIGSGGLPPAELHAWIERKRAEFNARSSAGDNNSHSGAGRRTAENNE